MKTYILILMILFCGLCKAQEPPGGFEIIKWYFNGFPKNHNGWIIEVEEGLYFHGDTEGTKFSIVNVTCDTCGFFDKYSFNVVLDYYSDTGTSLTVKQNKDTTDKYFKIEYPKFPYSLEKRKHIKYKK